ncbi:MAG: glycosyltransferase family 2 protein [Verrucomicrobiia bacterium]
MTSFLTTVIPVYNGEKYLKTTLDSIAVQKRKPDRVIVLDNCSTDRSRQIAQEYRRIPVTVIKNEKNIGLFGNLNRALNFAKDTDYLHILTADDLVLPDFFEKLISVLEDAEPVSIAFSRFELIDSDGEKLPPWWFIDYRDNGAPPREVPLCELLDKQCQMQTVLVPAAIIKTGGSQLPCSFRTDMSQVADTIFYAELAAHCKKIVEVREILCQYRIHPQNTTAQNVGKLDELSAEEWEGMQIIANLFNENKISHFFRFIKLKILHSARTEVCLEKSDLAKSEKRIARNRLIDRVGMLFWIFGFIAVKARNLYWKALRKKHTGPLGRE